MCNEFYCKDCPKRLNYPKECLIEKNNKMETAIGIFANKIIELNEMKDDEEYITKVYRLRDNILKQYEVGI